MEKCNHNWTTYHFSSEMLHAVYYPHGAPIYQICVKCFKKRIGYPQPIKWIEEEDVQQT